jgi:hypothetical protein
LTYCDIAAAFVQADRSLVRLGILALPREQCVWHAEYAFSRYMRELRVLAGPAQQKTRVL